MKKTTKTTKTSKAKTFEPKVATCFADIRDVKTDIEMICRIAAAKLCCGRNIGATEANILISTNISEYGKIVDAVIKSLRKRCADLKCELEWATRPWYKKMMFWKKKPACKR